MFFKTAFLSILASQIVIITGYQMYDEALEVCCGNSVSAITEAQSCCGSTSYDEDAQACCDGDVQPFPVEGERHYACCGTVAYSRAQSTCCGAGKLHWGASLACCGDRPYDVAAQECCEDHHAFDRKEGHQCCGGSVYYQVTTQRCCSVHGDDFTKWEMHPRSSNKTECCGLRAYNFQEEVCCGAELVPKPEALSTDEWGICCGAAVITDHEAQLCCDGALVERGSDETACCGAETYNKATQTCCGKEVLDGGSRACCWEAEASYDPETQACCGSAVVDLTRDEIDQLWDKNACCSSASLV